MENIRTSDTTIKYSSEICGFSFKYTRVVTDNVKKQMSSTKVLYEL